MDARFVARSIARPVRGLLQPWAFNARVLAVFPQVCDLIGVDGQVLALVDAEVGDGPLNVVMGSAPAGGVGGFREILAHVKPGMLVQMEGALLRVGDLTVDLTGAATWEPRPPWEELRARRALWQGQWPALRALALEQAPPDSLLRLLHADAVAEGDLARATQAAAGAAGALLRAGWAGSTASLREGAAWLAGLGGGLTPAGDDFLCGVMLAAWLAHPDPGAFCQAILEVAIPRTTTLSAAFLQAAGRGECGAAWHRLLAALAEGDPAGTVAALAGVLSHGATSGADALAGFLGMVLSPWGRSSSAPRSA